MIWRLTDILRAEGHAIERVRWRWDRDFSSSRDSVVLDSVYNPILSKSQSERTGRTNPELLDEREASQFAQTRISLTRSEKFGITPNFRRHAQSRIARC
jgi:hypothetical protein